MMPGSSKQRTLGAWAPVLGEGLEGVVGVRRYFRGKRYRPYWQKGYAYDGRNGNYITSHIFVLITYGGKRRVEGWWWHLPS